MADTKMLSPGAIVQEDETKRLTALRQYEILDTLPDPAFDEIARLAASICNATYAFIGFVDWSRVWFKSTVGFSGRQISRSGSPCQFVVLNAKPVVIGDAADDLRFRGEGIQLTNEVRFRSYAAAPLLSPTGATLGTLSVCSPEPHVFGRHCVDKLQALARQVMTRLELYAKGSELEQLLRTRQGVEQVLNVERSFSASVLNSIGVMVLVLDTAGRLIRFNRASEALSGLKLSDAIGQSFAELFFPREEREAAEKLFESARGGAESRPLEVDGQSGDAETRRIVWSATPLTNAQGAIGYVILTGVDVTELRRAESARQASEAGYRQLIESSHGFIFTHDMEGLLRAINPHGAAALGYAPEEMIGSPLSRYIDPEHLTEYASYFREVAEKLEKDLQGRFYLRARDGRLCIVEYRNRMLRLPDAEAFVLCHGIDITDRKLAEDKVHALMLRQQSILESAGDGICGIDLEGRFTFVNRSAAASLGYSPEELQGKDAHALVQHSRADGSPYPAEESPILASLRNASRQSAGAPGANLQSAPSEGAARMQNEVFWRKDGSSFPVEYSVCPLWNDGFVEGVVIAFEDVTERRRLDRMKDEFISTVSHELRTPLTSLRASLGLISGGVLDMHPEKAKQMLDIAVGNTDRLVRLVNDILDFEQIGSGSLPLHPAAWNAIDLLGRAVQQERIGAARAGVNFRIDAQPLDVWVDGDRTLQVLGNLIRNAVKFSERGGEIRLAASASGEREVLFAVQDRGRGIPADKLEIIFERFRQADASDSRVSGGAGLGLAICRGIVEQHGGRIWAESNPGQGSTFFFTLPRHFPPLEQAEEIPLDFDPTP